MTEPLVQTAEQVQNTPGAGDLASGDEVHCTVRVVNVRPRLIGDFVVLAGVMPNLVWFATNKPPILGELVRIWGRFNRWVESTQVLHDVRFEVVPEPFTRRHVHHRWYERVASVVQRELKPYQLEGAAWMASRLAEQKGAILGDDPGLGKTWQTIAAVLAAEALPCLVVCPGTLRYNWKREIDHVARWRLQVLDLSRSRTIEPAHFVLVNYEVLAKLEHVLLRYGFHSLVYDEAHAVKNPLASGRHQAAVAVRLSTAIKRVALLTGSPIPNRVEELWRLLHMTEPRVWGSFQGFKRRFASVSARDRPPGEVIKSSAGVFARADEFHALIGPSFLRRQKEHVLDLPAKRRRVLEIELDEVALAAYKAAEQDVVAWMRSIGREAVERRGRQALLRLTTLRRIAALGKLRQAWPRYCAAWLKHVNRPLVVFGYHRDVVHGAAKVATACGARVGLLSAAVPMQGRIEIIDAFNRDQYDVLCCPLKLAGTGQNLQHASDMVFLERFWTPSMMDQAEGRCHRIGVAREVVCTYFDARGTVDEYIARVARSKQRLIDHAVGDVHAFEVAKMLLGTGTC